jgi:hypothetical protein
MGKVLDFGYRSLYSQKLADKATSQKPAGAQVSEVSEPAPKVEPSVARAPKVRKVKVLVVTNSGAVTNAARQSRWRSKQDVVALRGQAKERMKGLRAQRKAGKAVAS